MVHYDYIEQFSTLTNQVNCAVNQYTATVQNVIKRTPTASISIATADFESIARRDTSHDHRLYRSQFNARDNDAAYSLSKLELIQECSRKAGQLRCQQCTENMTNKQMW